MGEKLYPDGSFAKNGAIVELNDAASPYQKPRKASVMPPLPSAVMLPSNPRSFGAVREKFWYAENVLTNCDCVKLLLQLIRNPILDCAATVWNVQAVTIPNEGAAPRTAFGTPQNKYVDVGKGLTQKRSVLLVLLAVTIVPFARTTSAATVVSSRSPNLRLERPNPP